MGEEGSREGTVLVVEADPVERERYGSLLDSAGFDVLSCPGPTGPDYTCLGSRDGVCPLLDDVDVVMLDMSLDSEAVMSGTPAEELLGLYLTAGRPVVVLGSRSGEDVPHQIVRLRRHPESSALLDAVRRLARAGRPDASGSP